MDLNKYNDFRREEFFSKAKKLSNEINNLIDIYDMEKEVVMIIAIGTKSETTEEEKEINMFYSYSIENELEFNCIMMFMEETMQKEFSGNMEITPPEIDNFLKELGISLET